jgi:hypothetical protein
MPAPEFWKSFHPFLLSFFLPLPMKIQSLLLLFLFDVAICTTLNAQPVLTANQLPQAGDRIVQDWMNTAPNQIPNEGANVTWDYSLNTFNSLDDSGIYRNLTSTLPGWNYNLAFEHYGSNQPLLDFYEVSSGEMRYAGYARSDQSFDTLIMSTSSILLPVPISFGSGYAQNLGGYYVNNGNNIAVSGRTFLDADAWGTLILPWITYSDILRVHVRDSLSIFGFPQINDSYYYYSASENFPVMVIQQKSPPTGYAVRPAAPVGIDEQKLNEQIRLFPNPASDQAWLDLPSGSSAGWRVNIMDMSGKILHNWNFADNGGGLVQLNLGNLPRGLYMVKVQSGTLAKVIYRKIVLN